MIRGMDDRPPKSRRRWYQFSVRTLLAVVPMMFMGLFIADPHAMPALIMTWIPFTAPITVILRLTLGELARRFGRS